MPMRVTYIIKSLLCCDGVGNSILELSRLLTQWGADLKILYQDANEAPNDLQELMVRVNYQQLKNRQGPPEVTKALAHWLASDVVFYDYPLYYPLVQAIALPGQGAKVFIYHGVTPPHVWSHWLGRKSLVRGMNNLSLVRHAHFAVAASAFTRLDLIGQGFASERTEIIPYAVPAEQFRPMEKDGALLDLWGLRGHFVLLYLGRMAGNKRISTLVEGLARVRKKGLPVKLLLVGDREAGAYLSEVTKVERLADRLGVREHLIFTGRVSDEALPRYYNLADLYVSASVHEGFGIPLVEAMAAAKPVVAARAASIPEVVQDGGRFFEPDDAAGMSEMVAEILGSVLQPPAAPARPPRLCFVVPGYGIELVSEAAARCRRWAEACRRADWTVQVVTTTTNDSIAWNDHFPEGEDNLNGVAVRRFPVERLESGIGAPRLFQWLKSHQEDFDFFVFLPCFSLTTLLGVEAVKDRALVMPCLADDACAHTSPIRASLEAAQALFFHSPAERAIALERLHLDNPNCFTLERDETRFLAKFREQLALLRTASLYERLAIRALARARHFSSRQYQKRWERFLSKVATLTRSASEGVRTPSLALGISVGAKDIRHCGLAALGEYHMAGAFSELPFTGERMVPCAAGDCAHEHLHRYALARELAADKVVVDIACGEGYGANLLAEAAREVTGIDISPEAIGHARRKYRRNNLRFQVGACSQMPVATATVDLVVSFETIEHHDRHREMLAEIKRVLRPEGVLMISTPDKQVYSDLPGYKNPFHHKELYYAEFDSLLKGFFSHVLMFGQRMGHGSLVAPLDESPGAVRFKTWQGNFSNVRCKPGLDAARYLIGIASDQEVPPPVDCGFFEGERLLDDRMLLERNMANLLASRSWRLTAPFRKTAGLIRRVRNTCRNFF